MKPKVKKIDMFDFTKANFHNYIMEFADEIVRYKPTIRKEDKYEYEKEYYVKKYKGERK